MIESTGPDTSTEFGDAVKARIAAGATLADAVAAEQRARQEIARQALAPVVPPSEP